MTKADEQNANIGEETMKQVGALEEATDSLNSATTERKVSNEDAQSWIGFIVQTLLMIFKPGK